MYHLITIWLLLVTSLMGCEPSQQKQDNLAIQAEKNSIEGKAFLEKNSSRPDIITTKSGLQYRIIGAGGGITPAEQGIVEVHYVGRFLDGTEFDSSVRRGMPAQFGVTQVIPGWTEALKLMSEGSKWELFIPSDLAYGPKGKGSIEPNVVLVFEVELLKANISR